MSERQCGEWRSSHEYRCEITQLMRKTNVITWELLSSDLRKLKTYLQLSRESWGGQQDVQVLVTSRPFSGFTLPLLLGGWSLVSSVTIIGIDRVSSSGRILKYL